MIAAIVSEDADRLIMLAIIAFWTGAACAGAYVREKYIRQQGTRYFRCKECSREHALHGDGSWHALRTIDEIRAHKDRAKLDPKS